MAMSLQKIKKIRDKKYTRWAQTLPCSSCGIEDETIVPHHIINVGDGCIGGKASDYEVMPLCYWCHAAIHAAGSDKEMQHIWLASTLRKAESIGFKFKVV